MASRSRSRWLARSDSSRCNRSTSNAATLWRWVSQGEGDLIITDVVMPDENAFELIPRIKATGGTDVVVTQIGQIVP